MSDTYTNEYGTAQLRSLQRKRRQFARVTRLCGDGRVRRAKARRPAGSAEGSEMRNAGPYSIGSDRWPGISKLIEECGEVVQVCGKILGTGGARAHWDGTDLKLRLEDEIADLQAAINFVSGWCDLNPDRMQKRVEKKIGLFATWHQEQRGEPK